ncbi:MAG: MFS transporter [Richelia sp.]|nr:MFS transporter [Richelia sp.]CDN10857.1 FIG097052: Sugar transporter [Richelia intracellularis]
MIVSCNRLAEYESPLLFCLWNEEYLDHISHMSWGAELSSDYYERSRVQGWRKFALLFGMLAVLLLPAIIDQAANSTGRLKVASMGWFAIILLPIRVAIAVWNVPEHPVPDPPQLGWRRATSIVFQKKLLLRVLLANLLIGIAPGITGSLYIFFVSYVMELPQWASLMLLAYFVASFCGIPAWIRFSYRFEKHHTFAFANIVTSMVLPVMLLVEPGKFWLYALANMLYGLCAGAGGLLLRAIMADVTDHDNLESGTQGTGLYYSLLSMTNKIGYAMAVGITYPMLDWIGFAPGSTNTPEAITALKYAFIFIPMPIMILAALIMWNFPLNSDRQQQLRRLLDERDSPVNVE